MLVLKGAHKTLKAHAGINNVHRQRLKRTVCLAVELHKDNVPYLYYLRIVLVYKLPSGHFRLLFRRS